MIFVSGIQSLWNKARESKGDIIPNHHGMKIIFNHIQTHFKHHWLAHSDSILLIFFVSF